MATATYAQFSVDAELVEDPEGTFTSVEGTGPMQVSQGKAFVLTEVKMEEPGGFRRLDMVVQK